MVIRSKLLENFKSNYITIKQSINRKTHYTYKNTEMNTLHKVKDLNFE